MPNPELTNREFVAAVEQEEIALRYSNTRYYMQRASNVRESHGIRAYYEQVAKDNQNAVAWQAKRNRQLLGIE